MLCIMVRNILKQFAAATICNLGIALSLLITRWIVISMSGFIFSQVCCFYYLDSSGLHDSGSMLQQGRKLIFLM